MVSANRDEAQGANYSYISAENIIIHHIDLRVAHVYRGFWQMKQVSFLRNYRIHNKSPIIDSSKSIIKNLYLCLSIWSGYCLVQLTYGRATSGMGNIRRASVRRRIVCRRYVLGKVSVGLLSSRATVLEPIFTLNVPFYTHFQDFIF